MFCLRLFFAFTLLFEARAYAQVDVEPPTDIVMPPDWHGHDEPPPDNEYTVPPDDSFDNGDGNNDTLSGNCTHYQNGKATRYDDAKFTGQPTRSGDLYDPNIMTAASNTLPMGTIVRICNRGSGRCAYPVKINDTGRFGKGVVVDLSSASARAIGLTLAIGKTDVEVQTCR